MLCAMRDISTDDVIAVHRTFLNCNDGKDGPPMMLGPSFETAVKLTPHRAVFDAKRHFASLLHVCEGIETGIGALMLGFTPVWALGTAGAIERFEPMLSVGELLVLADHDREVGLHHPFRPGIKAATACVRTWRAAGWRARWIAPTIEGEVYADVARREVGV